MDKSIVILLTILLTSCGTPFARIENDGTTTVSAPSLGGKNYVKVETFNGNKIEISTDHDESFDKGASTWLMRKIFPVGAKELGSAANNLIDKIQ